MKLTYPYKPLSSLLVYITAGLWAYAFSPSQYNSESVLKEGHWVKIRVSENGIHQITDAQLREMGFSDPNKVTVYGYGGAVITDSTFKTPLSNPTGPDCHPEDLPQIYSYHNSTYGRLLFYGEGNIRPGIGTNPTRIESINLNRYSNYGYYFLTDSKPQKSVPSYPTNSNTRNVTSHSVAMMQDINEENPTRGGAFYFSKDIMTDPNQSFTFDVQSPLADKNSAYLTYVAVAKYDPRPQLTVNIPEIVPQKGTEVFGTGDAQTSSNIYYSKCTGYLKFTPTAGASGPYTFSISPYNCSPSYAAIDWVFFSYKRANDLAGESQRRMIFPGLRSDSRVYIDNATRTTEVWDVTYPYYVRRFKTLIDSDMRLRFNPNRTYNTSTYPALHVIAFDYANGTFPTPEIVGVVPPQNLHGMATPDMVIITTSLCREQAERLARLHREHQGMDVAVVDQQEVFNEFSSGTPNAMAYRRFAKMLWDRDKSKFRYLLLFGEGSYDNARHQFKGNERLMTYQTEDYYQAASVTTNYCADSYFGMLSDYFSLSDISKTQMDIAVGRIPAANTSDAKTAVNKIERYLTTSYTQPYRNRALIMADDGDLNKYVMQSDYTSDTIKTASPATTTTKAYVGLYPLKKSQAQQAREVIINALQQGQSYVCYTGHGGPAGLTGEGLWNQMYVSKTEYLYPPFWMLSTCDTFSFDHLDNGFGEQLLYKENGGAIAFVGAGRTVYADSNYLLSTSVANAFFSAKPGDTVGEIFRNARNNTLAKATDNATGINTLCYNLGGDPAIPVFPPSYEVVTTGINGIVPDESNTAILTPLADNTISGAVTLNGQVATSFNGEVTISIYDGSITHPLNYSITELVEGKPVSKTINVTTDEQLLTEVCVPVSAGRFSTTLTVPQPMQSGQTNRVTYFATNDSRDLRASGITNNVEVGDYDPSEAITDTEAPVITEFYINDPSFADGDEADAAVTLFATIEADRSGINTSNGTIGGATALNLDGQKSYPSVRNALMAQPDGSYKLEMPIKDLNDGRHSLTLSVSDNMGNRSERTLAFTVVTRTVKASLSTDKPSTRTDATFDISHNFTETPTGRLVIEDANGNTVFSRDNCPFPFTWELTDTAGEKVADGLYRAYAILKAGQQYSNTAKCKVVVIK